MNIDEMQTLPQDIKCEQDVLGSMLTDKNRLVKFIEALDQDDFYRDAHRIIFIAISKLFALTERVRHLIHISISKKGYTKKSKTQEIVGCTFEQLKEHLENTWYNNYGTPYNGEPVHIDHIIPLSSAKNEEDVIKLCHYTNLQYLKPEDNMKKHDKLDYVLE